MTARLIGVCGFGRCGSTMVMTMLHAGGILPVPGVHLGTYEPDGLLDAGPLDSAWTRASLRDLDGRSVKLLDHIRHEPLPVGDQLSWSFVWLDRDPLEQAHSLRKFLNGMVTGNPRIPDASVWKLAGSFRRDRDPTLKRLRRRGPVLELRYEAVLADPAAAAHQLQQLVADHGSLDAAGGFDVDAAAAVVHDRDPGCRPDLAVEIALARVGA